MDADLAPSLLPACLAEAAAGLPEGEAIVVIVDGADEADTDLAWLPAPLPPRVRLIVSAGAAASAAAKVGLHARRPGTWINLGGLARRDAAAWLEWRLEQRAQRLSEAELGALLAHDGARSPRWLLRASERLRRSTMTSKR